MPVMMASTLTKRGADETVRALEIGAIDCIEQPRVGDDHSFEELPYKVKVAANARVHAISEKRRYALGQAADGRNLWRILAAHEDRLALRVRRLLLDRIAVGNAPWSANSWTAFCDELTVMLGIHDALTGAATTYLEFVSAGAADHDGPVPQPSKTLFEHDGVTVRLGSIHSIKGKTVDGLLVVETEVWRGQALANRAMDLATVLPHAFGLEDRDFSANIAQLAAATNIFVAATRPRQLLACAVRKAAVTDDLVDAARAQGWQVCDLTAGLAGNGS